MAYTNAEKVELYDGINEDLTKAVMKLQDFIESDDTAPDAETPEEYLFAESVSSQLTNLVGNLAIRAKRCEAEA